MDQLFTGLQAWWSFSHAPLNCHCFLASDLLSHFYATSVDKPVIGLGSYLVDEFIVGLPRADESYQNWLTFSNALNILVCMCNYLYMPQVSASGI